jgi:hypothetical protein
MSILLSFVRRVDRAQVQAVKISRWDRPELGSQLKTNKEI